MTELTNGPGSEKKCADIRFKGFSIFQLLDARYVYHLMPAGPPAKLPFLAR
jgi:hypothetical protein